MSFKRRGQAALATIQSAQAPSAERLVYSFLSCFNLSKDSVLIACSMRQASFSAVFGSTPASISIAEKNWCFSSVISATERDFGDRTARFGQDQETTLVHSQKSFRTQRGNRVAYTWLRYLQMLCYIHRPYHPHSPLKE